MSNDDPIVRLLTEIRDNQREEIAWRKKTIEESVRLQRASVRFQRFGMIVVGIAIAVGVLLVIFGNQLFGWYR